MKILDLGDIDAPVLLFGGPYSNYQALDALMKWADKHAILPVQQICTGDIVAYCADAAGCVDLMRGQNSPVIRGNCEVQLAKGAPDCGCGFDEGSACSILSDGWYPYAQANVSESDRIWMADLPDWLVFRHHGRRFAVIHGGASDVSRFLWPTSSDADFRQEISQIEREIGAIDGVIAGHSGIAFSRQIDHLQWINAGVIGMPQNDGSRQTRFAVLEGGQLRMETLHYDSEGAACAMEMAGLTHGYHTGLRTGYWPSQDILPADLRCDLS